MSLEARHHLCERLFFQNDSQRADLIDPKRTETGLIALLLAVLAAGFEVEITAVRSDHHDDSALGLHSHANGYAVDCWPLRTRSAGDYMDAESRDFQDFLEAVVASSWCYQVGLAGSAKTDANRHAAKPKCFEDDGEDHVHIGSI